MLRSTLRVVCTCLACTLLVAVLTARAGADAPFPVIGRTAPEVALTDQHRRPVRLTAFRGRVVLLTFIYTHCPDVCPLTTAALARVQRTAASRGWWGRDVTFLTVTTDPQRDTARVLAEYARRYRADMPGWHFLTCQMISNTCARTSGVTTLKGGMP